MSHWFEATNSYHKTISFCSLNFLTCTSDIVSLKWSLTTTYSLFTVCLQSSYRIIASLSYLLCLFTVCVAYGAELSKIEWKYSPELHSTSCHIRVSDTVIKTWRCVEANFRVRHAYERCIDRGYNRYVILWYYQIPCHLSRVWAYSSLAINES